MKKLSGILLALALVAPGASVAHAATLSSFELTGVAEIISYNSSDDFYATGTGFATGYTDGCYATAAHVVLDDLNNVREETYVMLDAGTENEMTYTAYVVAAYTDTDVAFVCMNDAAFSTDEFRHFFPLGLSAYQSFEIGDEVTTLGYPGGEGSATASFGQVTGFEAWSGDRDLIKMSAPVAEGVSGAPVLSEEKEVMGMVTGRDEAGEGQVETSYAVSADLLELSAEQMSKDVLAQLESVGITPPADCGVNADASAFVDTEGNAYYDMFCTQPKNAALEATITQQYEHWCGVTPNEVYVFSAAAELTDATTPASPEAWKTYLTNLCGELDAGDMYAYATPDQTLAARLVKSATSETVYAVLADGKRHPFASEEVYTSWMGSDFSSVEVLTAEELAVYPVGASMTFRPGDLVKTAISSKVYLVTDEGALRWVSDEATAVALAGENWANDVHDISEALLTSYAGMGEVIQL